MDYKMKFSLSAILAVAACLTSAVAMAQSPGSATTPCVVGYTVGFFNGVGNTLLEAEDGAAALRDATPEATGTTDGTYNHEDIGYQVFYNHTGSTVGASVAQDVAEVFVQRAHELDSTGYFETHELHLFWEFLDSLGPGSLTSKLPPTTNFKNFLKALRDNFVAHAVATLSTYASTPPSASDTAQQDATLTTLAAAGRKLLLTAHSQGNLFLNPAYDFIQPVVGSNRVKAVHIAPASPTIRGQYILSDLDLVINALRLLGGSMTIQPTNISIPFSPSDTSGHEIVETYLDASRNGRAATVALLANAFSAFPASNCAVTVTPVGTMAQPSQVIALTATLKPPVTDMALATEYSWDISGNAGGTFSGGTTTLNTSSPSVNYITSATATSQQLDTITVKVLVTKTAGDYVNVETLGTSTATVTVTSGVTLSPQSSSITQTGTATLTASVPGVSANNANYSYKWTTGGTAGQLKEVNGAPQGAGTSFCTDATIVNYIPNSMPLLTAAATDVVTVTAYKGAGCSSSTIVGTAPQAVVIVSPSSIPPNGDFSQGLTDWTQFGTATTTVTTTPPNSFADLSSCIPSQNGNPFALVAAYAADGGIEQTFTMPSNATQLSMRTWNNLDPVTVTISLVAAGQETVLQSFSPPSMQKLSDPNNYDSVVCTGAAPASVTYDVTKFHGQSVTLKLRGTYISGINGTFASFDDVAVK